MEQHILRIDTPPDIATGPDGQPGFIVLKTRFRGKYRYAFYDAVDLAKEIKSLGDDATEDQVNDLLRQLRESKALITEAYTQLVIDWNWIDDSGQPLPKPTIPGVVQGELYPEQENWVNDQLKNLFKLRGTEGNARSGPDSTPG